MGLWLLVVGFYERVVVFFVIFFIMIILGGFGGFIGKIVEKFKCREL